MDNNLEATDKIARLIRARYPVIAVQSHEELRVLDSIQAIAETQGKKLYTWAISSGLTQIWPTPETVDADMADLTVEPTEAMRYVLQDMGPTAEHPLGEEAIVVMKDLHAFLDAPVVLRWVRDLAGVLIKRHQTVILLSPQIEIPLDAEKDIATVDFPLPAAAEISAQIDAFVANSGITCNLNGGREHLVRALQGLTATEADAVMAQAAIAKGHLDTDAIPFVLGEKAEIVRKSGALEYYAEQTSYREIGGLDLLKEWAQETELAYSEEAKAYGIEPPKGVLIVGVPGCGKSLTAKAIAGGTRPLLRLDVGALFGSLVGQSEAQTRNALKVAEAIAPCVLWIDEIEKALGSSGGETDGGTAVRVLGTILTWMQETQADVFVVATANDISSLRPELVRRFAETFFVDLPNLAERTDILAIHMGKRGRTAADFDLAEVALATNQFTGSELEKVVQGALRRAFADGARELTVDDLLLTAAMMVPLAQTMSTSIDVMRKWASRARPASSRQETGNPKATNRAIEL